MMPGFQKTTILLVEQHPQIALCNIHELHGQRPLAIKLIIGF